MQENHSDGCVDLPLAAAALVIEMSDISTLRSGSGYQDRR
jgi:hypothetical protein